MVLSQKKMPKPSPGALIILGLIASFAISFYAGILIFIYIVLVSAYSLYIKRKRFFEAFFLTLVYLLRIFIGVLVIDTGVSQAMILFPLFFFFFLILVKRHTELLLYVNTLENDPTGRGYQTGDINLIQWSCRFICIYFHCLFLGFIFLALKYRLYILRPLICGP